ncbi:hypothetical protein AAVH_43027, partial [Aphelenchoides avenae]
LLVNCLPAIAMTYFFSLIWATALEFSFGRAQDVLLKTLASTLFSSKAPTKKVPLTDLTDDEPKIGAHHNLDAT